tara:strand:- start:107 stop:796 length:690 start_codon:yes stop_codon:yes gene_type:complete
MGKITMESSIMKESLSKIPSTSDLLPVSYESSKPKIFCLHGGGQSASSFELQLIDLMNALPEFEFVFAETPEIGNVWIRDPPDGKDHPTTDPDWARKSHLYLDQIVREEGPFYAILGYSQGGAMVLAYLAYLQENNKLISFEKVILFNSYFPETHYGLMSSIRNLLTEVPIFKIVGKNDILFYELGKTVYDELKNSDNIITLIEDEILGHYPPLKGYSSFKEVVNFINY